MIIIIRMNIAFEVERRHGTMRIIIEVVRMLKLHTGTNQTFMQAYIIHVLATFYAVSTYI